MLSDNDIKQRLETAENAVRWSDERGLMSQNMLVRILRELLTVYDHLSEQANAKEKAKP